MIKSKNIIINFLLVIFSFVLTLLVLNYILIHISQKQKIPRILAGSLPNYYFTFYPDTYENRDIDNYIAVLGDSYAQGSGDAYLSKEYKYSISHFLRDKTNLNYLNFARGGYGSIASVLNLERIIYFSYNDILIENLKHPEEIIYFFYEGNDLTENMSLFLEAENTNINDYFENEIKRLTLISDYKKNIEINFPIVSYLKILGKKLFLQINNLKSYRDLVGYYNQLLSRIKGNQEIMIRNYNKDKFKNKNITVNQFIFPQIESGFTLLKKKQINQSLEIFYLSMNYLKNKFPSSKIKIIYIPSLPTIYEFNDPINTWSNYAKKKKFENVITTRDQNEQNSLYVRESINQYSIKNNLFYLDLTKSLQNFAKQNIIHGSIDYGHFNKLGYEFFSKEILKSLN